MGVSYPLRGCGSLASNTRLSHPLMEESQYLSYDQAVMQQSPYYPGQGFGYDVIPEEVAAMMIPEQGEGELQRQVEAAVQSWRVGKVASGSWTSGLGLSARHSEVDLKDFLVQRGNHQLEGLHKAAAQGDRAGIMHLMKVLGPGDAIDRLDVNGCSPLMYAVMADSRLAVEMLLNFSARREQLDTEGRTAVHYAAFFGKHRTLKFLIESAADWTPRDIYGWTPLHWSCANKTTKALQILLKHSQTVFGNINPQDNEGMTPLHCAAYFGRPKHIALLNEAESDFTAVDIEEKTPLHWTLNNPDASCIQALIDAYPPLLNKRDMNGSTILHLAAANGSTHLVNALLRLEGIDMDARDNLERTALHYACIEGHPEVVQLLLQFRALDSCIDSQGFTALHYAVQNNAVSSIQVFAGLPEVTHIPDGEGRTPLMVAAQNGFDQAVKALLKNAGILKSINHAEINGRSALHLAAQAGSASCVSTLLSGGADPNQTDNLQQSPLFPTCEGGHPDCIQTLITGGCQSNTHDADGQAPLHKAVLYNQPAAVQALVLAGADLNILDTTGTTALHMASYGGNDRILSLLLDNSASTSVQDSNGMSPVHYAALEGHVNALTILLSHHAYANFMDFSENRHTPVDYAEVHGHNTCVDVLMKAGGVSTRFIRDMAATSIQTVYRGYRARMLRSELSLKGRAVTVIATLFRGYRQRKRYSELKRRQYAAVRIQAAVRGYLQRCKFQDCLSKYREQERNRKLMEEFGRKLMSDRDSSLLHVFTEKLSGPGIVLETHEDGKEPVMEKEEQTKEQRLRLEFALKMREVYEQQQKYWQEFRDAERQRRIDKANQEELDRMEDILTRSRARREYSQAKFGQMLCVRSYYDAAVTIQRAYRRMMLKRSLQIEQATKESRRRRQRENRAALVIQLAWRRYKQRKVYEALHFKAIMTSPVIAFPAHRSAAVNKLEGLQSYHRHISITGSPKRKVHLTEQSGFRVFRPATRDLLMRADRDNEPLTSPPRRTANKAKEVRILSPAEYDSPSGISTQKSPVRRRELPDLFPPEIPAGKPKPKNGQVTVHLPQIVRL